jgi:multidrug efflux pump subunit AcrA (membrane-fusion protein)
MLDSPQTYLNLGKRSVSPKGVSVWAWPAEDSRFAEVIAHALGLKPARELNNPEKDVWSIGDEDPTPENICGVIFVSLEDPTTGLESLQTIRSTWPNLRAIPVGQSELVQNCCEESPTALRLAFNKATAQGLFALVNRHPREIKFGGSVLAAIVLIAAGLMLRGDTEEPLEASAGEFNVHNSATELVLGGNRGVEANLTPLEGQLFMAESSVRIPQTGVVRKLLVEEGDLVEKGTLIAILADLQHAAKAEALRVKLAMLEQEFERRQVRATDSTRSADDSRGSTATEATFLATQHRDAAAKVAERITWLDDQVETCQEWVTLYEERISEDPNMRLAYETPLAALHKRMRTLASDKENLQKSARQEIASALSMESLTETIRRNESERTLESDMSLNRLESEIEDTKTQVKHHADFENISFVSPWAGEVTQFDAKVGSVIPAQSEFLKLRSDSSLFVLLPFQKRYLVAVGDNAAIRGKGNFHASGFVTEINDSKNGLLAKINVMEVHSGRIQNKMPVQVFPEEGSY